MMEGGTVLRNHGDGCDAMDPVLIDDGNGGETPQERSFPGQSWLRVLWLRKA